MSKLKSSFHPVTQILTLAFQSECLLVYNEEKKFNFPPPSKFNYLTDPPHWVRFRARERQELAYLGAGSIKVVVSR